MFVIGSMNVPFTASLKVQDEEFEELAQRPGIVPAPYLARYKWVLVQQPEALTVQEWEHYIRKSYTLIKAKLPKKVLKEAGLLA